MHCVLERKWYNCPISSGQNEKKFDKATRFARQCSQSKFALLFCILSLVSRQMPVGEQAVKEAAAMKLRSKMMLAICIPVMVVLVLLSGVAYWQASRALSEEIRMEMSQASARYAEAVQTILSTKQETVGSLAAAWSVSLPADEEILRTVTYLTKNTPGAQDIYVAFPSKKFIEKDITSKTNPKIILSLKFPFPVSKLFIIFLVSS